jgi:hypothetical protein
MEYSPYRDSEKRAIRVTEVPGRGTRVTQKIPWMGQ